MLALWKNVHGLDRRLSSFDEMRREMDRLFMDFDSWFTTSRSPGPRIRLVDGEKELVVRAEMPGFEEKDLEITLEKGTLTIRGEREYEPPEGYRPLRRERGSLSFSHAFLLPCKVDGEKAKASLKDGLFELVLPKAEEARPRQIPVASA